MPMPTKEQWDEIAAKLDRFYSHVFLRCDGYLVSANMERVSANRLAIAVAVNGYHLKGEWLPINGREMSEEARRFLRPAKKARMSQKELKSWERLIGKRECRSRGYYEPRIWPDPFWPRPRPFIAHLKKHNQSIEVLDYETYSREVEALQRNEKPGL